MSSPVDRQLPASSPAAEKGPCGPNDWVAYEVASSAACTAVHAAKTGLQHFVTALQVTADANINAVTTVTLADDTSTFFFATVGVNFRELTIPFPKPINGGVGQAMTLTFGGTGNGATATAWMSGYSEPGP